MSLLSRLTRPRRPRYDTKVVTPEENKVANPETPIPDVEPIIKLVQLCAFCGKNQAAHPVKVGWFYLGSLPYVGVCDDCHAIAEDGKKQHYENLHRAPIAEKETLEVSALEAKKPRRTRLTRIEETERTPSRPLEDRVHNLATGA